MNSAERRGDRAERILAAWVDADSVTRAELRREAAAFDAELAIELELMDRMEVDLASEAVREAEILTGLEVSEQDAERMRDALERGAPVRRLDGPETRRWAPWVGLSAVAGLLAMLWLGFWRPSTPEPLDPNPALGTGDLVLVSPLEEVEAWEGLVFIWSEAPRGSTHVQVVVEDLASGVRTWSRPLRDETRWRPSADQVSRWGEQILWTVEIHWPGAEVPTGPPPIQIGRTTAR